MCILAWYHGMVLAAVVHVALVKLTYVVYKFKQVKYHVFLRMPAVYFNFSPIINFAQKKSNFLI